MNSTTLSGENQVRQLCQLLAYTRTNGWVTADQFDNVQTHRFALMQSRELIGVQGAFCWLVGDNASVISAPLVYVATADNRTQAKIIHHKTWSQGLVPFLIVTTPDEIFVCSGFCYNADQWDQCVNIVRWDSISALNDSAPVNSDARALFGLQARQLRSSVFWREHSIDVSGRVDQVILSGLSDLSHNLIKGIGVQNILSHTAANGLIGKLLYLYFLADRGIINQDWLSAHGHKDIELNNPSASWSKRAFWKLLDDLDSIFNGSIFPLSAEDRSQIDITHIDLTKSILKFNAKAYANGALQLSFIDVDLSVLRVETLSAVYEQFLENVRSGERRKVGAFYTPPFLVDLVLDCVEEEQPLKDGVTVLDPTAGSGVFLVGSYRRILEHARAQSPTPLTLEQVRGLLVRNIFGVERNQDACNVTAFSLYLTMLDYVTPRDLGVVAAGKDPRKLFPSLIGTNLFAEDFFSGSIRSALPPICCVVGNPPWQTVRKLESPMASDWITEHPDCPIGKDQAAELFVWKALREHLVKNGVLAMLLPTKSIVNPSAVKFRSHLQDEACITGAINFSHMRYRLFPGARHACAALLLRKRKAKPSDWTWVYSPLSISQPVASKDAWPWTLIRDKAEVQYFRHDILASVPSAWFEAFVLRPIDRQIKRYIADSVDIGSINLLNTLCEKIGARHKRGGEEEATGVPSEYLENQNPLSSSVKSRKTQATGDLFDTTKPVPVKKERLPSSLLAKTHPSYKHQFSGNVLLVPRNFQDIRFVDYPKAYNSSIHAVFFDKNGAELTPKEKQFLRALERYLKSDVALYFLATTSTRWLIDRRNVEKGDFGNIPVPFTSLDDERIERILAVEASQLENYILKAFRLDIDQCSAIKEFLHFRMGFQDGNVPSNALVHAKVATLENYAKVFQRSLDGLIGRKGAFTVAHLDDRTNGFGVVVACYADENDQPPLGYADLIIACKKTIETHSIQGTNPFADSLEIRIDPATSTLSVTKPLEYFRWTVDWAYTDSRRAMDALMRGEA
jgi:hypothetical protein